MLVVIQNDPEVPLGAFAGQVAEEGVPHRTVRPYAGESLPPLSGVTAALVLGGAMGVHDEDRHPFLAGVKGFVRECMARAIPFLGICLGGQLLADVLGAPVTPNACGERGSLTVRLSPEGRMDPLFAGVPEEFVTFQWHNDCFALPQGAVLLASSPACPGQAFRFGGNAYGLQFHPEVDRAIVRLWARETAETAPAAGRFLADFIVREDDYRRASRRLFDNFLQIARLRQVPGN
ncbi:MAG TPA: type 1 glutamine amidotransferase [Geobacteraceae bacterium]